MRCSLHPRCTGAVFASASTTAPQPRILRARNCHGDGHREVVTCGKRARHRVHRDDLAHVVVGEDPLTLTVKQAEQMGRAGFGCSVSRTTSAGSCCPSTVHVGVL